jgi:hypothetical protein
MAIPDPAGSLDCSRIAAGLGQRTPISDAAIRTIAALRGETLEGQAVALHHSGVFKRDAQGKPVVANGQYVYEANEGVRISAIVAAVKAASLTAEARSLLDPFITA